MIGIAATAEGRQPHPSAGRAHHDHVADLDGAGHDEVEIGEELHATRPDEVSAGLVARERGLVDEGHPGTAPGEDRCRGAAGGAGADYHDVETIVGHGSSWDLHLS